MRRGPSVSHYLGDAAPRTSRLAGMTLQESGGTSGVVDTARRHLHALLEECAGEKRVEVSASKLIVGLNCGGTDSFSGITAVPGSTSRWMFPHGAG